MGHSLEDWGTLWELKSTVSSQGICSWEGTVEAEVSQETWGTLDNTERLGETKGAEDHYWNLRNPSLEGYCGD